jgi:hypothetical protein
MSAQAATTKTISQFGVTFELDSAVEYGTYANGDYWVMAPITVTNMTPAWGAISGNGWEINPKYQFEQGFYDGSPAFNYTSALRVAMPFTIATNCTLVKTIGTGTSGTSVPLISRAVALSIVTNTPAGNGASVFRPPYSGDNKPEYLVSSIRSDLLPAYVVTSGAPSLAQVESTFTQGIRMDHRKNISRPFRPISAFAGDYSPDNYTQENEAMLRLMGSDSYAAKQAALIQFTQFTIDMAWIYYQGYRQGLGDGHNPNHRVLGAWAAIMLNDTTLKGYFLTATGFHEDTFLFMSPAGVVLWGDTKAQSEFNYWNYIMGGGGSKSYPDPYQIIDGGKQGSVGASYQNITSQAFKGQALIYNMFPELKTCIPAGSFTNVNDYASRWVTHGTWTLPDPAAPYDGNPANYGITFGPDGAGSYIAGPTRFGTFDGSNTDGGQHQSAFVRSMWDAYYGGGTPPSGGSPPATPTGFSATVSGTTPVSQVDIAWTVSAGATEYRIYRGTTTGILSLATVVANGAATSVTDTGLSAITTYFYAITAASADGESAQSSETSATTGASTPSAVPLGQRLPGVLPGVLGL